MYASSSGTSHTISSGTPGKNTSIEKRRRFLLIAFSLSTSSAVSEISVALRFCRILDSLTDFGITISPRCRRNEMQICSKSNELINFKNYEHQELVTLYKVKVV